MAYLVANVCVCVVFRELETCEGRIASAVWTVGCCYVLPTSIVNKPIAGLVLLAIVCVFKVDRQVFGYHPSIIVKVGICGRSDIDGHGGISHRIYQCNPSNPCRLRLGLELQPLSIR